MKKKHDIAKMGFQTILQSKYLVILALLGVMIIMASSYISEYHLWIAYVALGFVTLTVFGLYKNIHFQKLHKKLRPFVIMRILQAIATISYVALIYWTYPMAKESWTAYIVYWLLGLATVYQFFSVFRLASQAKKDFPDRCEFC